VRLFLASLALLAQAAAAAAAESPPPPPPAYFNDFASFVPASEAARLDAKLKQFADDTSTQLLVVIFPQLPEGAALEDFTVTTAQSWRVGQKKHDNGAVLFIFAKDRKLRIEVGYGLEGALPDAIAKRIVDETIVPSLRAGDPVRALEAGIDAMMAATRGEYTAPPRTRPAPKGLPVVFIIVFVVVLLIIVSAASQTQDASAYRRGRTYGRRGPFWGGGGWGGGGFGGGGSSGGGGFGGGGFSGGGGSFGGGGASGSW